MSTKKNNSNTTKKTTAKKRGRPAKKTKLDSLSMADGKKEDGIKRAKELEELVGLNEVNPFGTALASVFEESLGEMGLVDLQALAVKVGVFPSGTATSLRNKLKKAFRDHQRGSSSFVIPMAGGEVVKNVDKESESFKKAIKLMKEGL